LSRDTGTRIRYSHDGPARLHARAHLQSTAVGHGLSRVADEVEEGLANLVFVGERRRRLGLDLERDLLAGALLTLKLGQRTGDDPEILGLELGLRKPRKAKVLLGDVGQ